MKHLNIFLGNEIFELLEGDIIAVDGFGIKLIEAGYSNFVSIGDFDSCSNDEYDLIKMHSKIIKFPQKKDEGDFELALMYARDHNYTDVTIYNINCGNRIDHLLNNIFILKKYKAHFNLIIKDKYNLMYFLTNETVLNSNEFTYVSLVFLKDTVNLNISDDFKYPYKGNVSKFDTRFISNELKNKVGRISYESGEVFLILSKD